MLYVYTTADGVPPFIGTHGLFRILRKYVIETN